MTSIEKPTKTASDEEPLPLDDIVLQEEVTAKAGCGILGRYPLISVISFAAVGLAIGIVSIDDNSCFSWRASVRKVSSHVPFPLHTAPTPTGLELLGD